MSSKISGPTNVTSDGNALKSILANATPIHNKSAAQAAAAANAKLMDAEPPSSAPNTNILRQRTIVHRSSISAPNATGSAGTGSAPTTLRVDTASSTPGTPILAAHPSPAMPPERRISTSVAPHLAQAPTPPGGSPPRTPNRYGPDVGALQTLRQHGSILQIHRSQGPNSAASNAQWGIEQLACASGNMNLCPPDLSKQIDNLQHLIMDKSIKDRLKVFGIQGGSLFYTLLSPLCITDPCAAATCGTIVKGAEIVQQYRNIDYSVNTDGRNKEEYNKVCVELRERFTAVAKDLLARYAAQKISLEANQKAVEQNPALQQAQTLSLEDNRDNLVGKLREKLKMRESDALRRKFKDDPTENILRPLFLAADIIKAQNDGVTYNPKESQTAKTLLEHLSTELQKAEMLKENIELKALVERIRTHVKLPEPDGKKIANGSAGSAVSAVATGAALATAGERPGTGTVAADQRDHKHAAAERDEKAAASTSGGSTNTNGTAVTTSGGRMSTGAATAAAPAHATTQSPTNQTAAASVATASTISDTVLLGRITSLETSLREAIAQSQRSSLTNQAELDKKITAAVKAITSMESASKEMESASKKAVDELTSKLAAETARRTTLERQLQETAKKQTEAERQLRGDIRMVAQKAESDISALSGMNASTHELLTSMTSNLKKEFRARSELDARFQKSIQGVVGQLNLESHERIALSNATTARFDTHRLNIDGLRNDIVGLQQGLTNEINKRRHLHQRVNALSGVTEVVINMDELEKSKKLVIKIHPNALAGSATAITAAAATS